MPKKTANELMDEMAEEPTLDQFYDRNPKSLSDDDLRVLIENERRKRALYIEKKSG